MTTIEMTEQVAKMPRSESILRSDPYPVKTPFQFITREYLLHEVAMSSNQSFQFYPFEELKSKTTISRYLSLFRYFRSHVKVKIAMISTPLQYGVLAVSALPFCQDANAHIRIEQQSQSDMVLMDVGEQEALFVDLPWVSPYLYDDVLGPNPKYWRVIVNMLSLSTLTTDTPSTVNVQIYAHFVNPEAAGYTPATFQAAPPGSEGFRRMANTLHTVGQLARVGVRSTYASMPAAATVGSMIGAAAYRAVEREVSKEAADTIKETVQPLFVEKTEESMKLDLCSDLSSPEIHALCGTALGDNKRKNFVDLPQQRNIYAIKDICCVPTFSHLLQLSDWNTFYDLNLDPFINYSYAWYIQRMFKFWRTGCKVYVKIASSPLVSAKVRFTLFPSGILSDTVENIADCPTWIVSVKGSTQWSIGVPYLQRTPWLSKDNTIEAMPVLRTQLLEPLSQPFDKDVSITLAFFISASEDIEFAGLESCTAATFQSAPHVELLNTPMLGSTSPRSFQGGVETVYDVLGRYSSRVPEVQNLLPWPITIASEAVLDKLDNFDYLSNLYKFFCGDTHVKVLFSGAPANGVLQVALASSKGSYVDTNFNAGNSIAVSHQAVWPLIEFTYPYLSTLEYQALDTPSLLAPSTYGFVVDDTATISKMWIGASPSFRLSYLMPVPDFVYPAQFQAANFNHNEYTFAGRFENLYGDSYVTIPLPSLPDVYLVSFELQSALTRSDGSTNDSFLLFLSSFIHGGPISFNEQLQDVYVSNLLQWTDVTNSGNYTVSSSQSSTRVGVFPTELYLNACSLIPVSSSKFSLDYCLRLCTCNSAAYPTAIGSTYIPVHLQSQSGPLDTVTLLGSQTSVNNSSIPIEIPQSELPLKVTFYG